MPDITLVRPARDTGWHNWHRLAFGRLLSTGPPVVKFPIDTYKQTVCCLNAQRTSPQLRWNPRDAFRIGCEVRFGNTPRVSNVHMLHWWETQSDVTGIQSVPAVSERSDVLSNSLHVAQYALSNADTTFQPTSKSKCEEACIFHNTTFSLKSKTPRPYLPSQT